MSDDRFQRALSEANASRLIDDVQEAGEMARDRHVLESWAKSLIKRLDELMDGHVSFGVDPGVSKVDYGYERTAAVAYTRTGTAMKMTATAIAHLEGGGPSQQPLLFGADFELQSAVMEVEIEILDTKQTSTASFRYGLDPWSKVVSIDDREQFLARIERLVAEAGRDRPD